MKRRRWRGAFSGLTGDGKGNVTFFASKKVTKKPVVYVCWLVPLSRQFYEKGFGIRSASKLALGFQALFQFASQTPAGAAVRTAALVRVAFDWRRFCCGKNERVSRCGAGNNASCGWRFSRSFRRSETAFPRGRFMQQADCAAIASAKRIEKRTEAEGRACSDIRILLFSYSLPQYLRQQKLVFGGARGELLTQKLPLERSLYFAINPLNQLPRPYRILVRGVLQRRLNAGLVRLEEAEDFAVIHLALAGSHADKVILAAHEIF